jgi:tetratricopeptide (TPR) repeat protein
LSKRILVRQLIDWRPYAVLGLAVLGVFLARPVLGVIYLNLGVVTLHKATLAGGAGDFGAARRYLERSQGLMDSTAALQNEGVLALEQEDYNLADYTLDQAVERSPDDPLVKWFQAEVYLATDRRALATQTWREIGAGPRFLALAEAQFNVGQMLAAREDYELYLDIAPDNAYALRRIGETYYAGKEYDAALLYYERSLSVDSSQDRVYYLVGRLYRDKGELGRAIGYYEQAAKLAPMETWYYIELAQIYEGLGQFGEADKWYEQARLATPESERPYLFYGMSLLNRGRVDEAIAQLEIARQYNTDNCGVLLRYGDALAAAGRYEEALAAYRESVLDVKPCGWESHMHMGDVYRRMSMPAEARQEYEHVLELYPDFAPAVEALQALQDQE